MVELARRLEILDSIGLRVLEKLGFDPTTDQHFPLAVVEEAIVEVVEMLFYDTVCILAGADNSTGEWTSELDDIVDRHLAALAVITHLSEMIA